MKNPFDDAFMKTVREAMESPTMRAQRDLEKLARTHAGTSTILNHAGVNLFSDTFVSRYHTAEEQLRRVLMSTTQSPAQVFANSFDRAIEAMRRDPLADLISSTETPWAGTMQSFQRAIEQWAGSASWVADGVTAAAVLDAYSESVDDLDNGDDVVTITPTGDVVVAGETTSATQLNEALRQATAAAEKLAASAPATKQDLVDGLENLRRELTPKLSSKLLDMIGAIGLSILANRIDDKVFEPATVGTPAQTVLTAPALADAARLYRVTATSLHLRAEPSTEAEIRVALKHGEVVHVVERGRDGWILVRAQRVGSSFEQGWVWIEYLEPVR